MTLRPTKLYKAVGVTMFHMFIVKELRNYTQNTKIKKIKDKKDS